MGKFYPPATASPKLPQGNEYMMYFCAVGGKADQRTYDTLLWG
jgi:hypothetical protein